VLMFSAGGCGSCERAAGPVVFVAFWAISARAGRRRGVRKKHPQRSFEQAPAARL